MRLRFLITVLLIHISMSLKEVRSFIIQLGDADTSHFATAMSKSDLKHIQSCFSALLT